MSAETALSWWESYCASFHHAQGGSFWFLAVLPVGALPAIVG
jgi:hypothetical protein